MTKLIFVVNAIAVVVAFLFYWLAGFIINLIARTIKLRNVIPLVGWIILITLGAKYESPDWLAFAFLGILALSVWIIYRSIYLNVTLKKVRYVEEHKDHAWSSLLAIYLLYIGLITSFPYYTLQTRFHISINAMAVILICSVFFTYYLIYFLSLALKPYIKLKKHIRNHGFIEKKDLVTKKFKHITEQKEFDQYMSDIMARFVQRNIIVSMVSNDGGKVFVSRKKLEQIQKHEFPKYLPIDLRIEELSQKCKLPRNLVKDILNHLKDVGKHSAVQEVAASLQKSISNNATISDNFRLLRFSLEGHPLVEESYALRKSYFQVFSYALEDLKLKHPIIDQLIEIYAVLLGITKEDHERILQSDIRESNPTLEQAFQEVKKNHYKKITWYKYNIDKFNQALFADVIYLRKSLVGMGASAEFAALLGKSLRIGLNDQEEIKKYVGALITWDIKTAHMMLYNNIQSKMRDKLEFLFNRVSHHLEYERQSKYQAAVVATMSAGKSTFVNALMGYDLFPSKNQACTAKISRIANNDLMDHAIGYSFGNKSTALYSSLVDSKTLNSWNEDDNNEGIYVESKLEGISNSTWTLNLFDTPGTNYSQDRTHNEITYRFLEKNNLDLILYVINATQIATDDDKVLLIKVLDSIKNKKYNTQILFLMNKADEFDLDGDDNLTQSVINVRSYLHEADVPNPEIIPISSHAAKLFRMVLRQKKMSKKELSDFRSLYRLFIDDEVDLSSYASSSFDIRRDSLLFSNQPLLVGDREYQSEDIRKALFRTGIPTVESKIMTITKKITISVDN